MLRKLCKSLGQPVDNITTPLVDGNNNNVGELILTLTLTAQEKNTLVAASAHTTNNTPVTVTEGILKIKKIVVYDVVGNELLGGKDALYVRVGVDDWQVTVDLHLSIHPNLALL